MFTKIKEILVKISVVWNIIKSIDNVKITESCLHKSVKNIDLTSNGVNYVCFENKDGGFDIVYSKPLDFGHKYLTLTVSRLKGANAGAIADATLEILNNHTMSDMVCGDNDCQAKPSIYIEYTREANE